MKRFSLFTLLFVFVCHCWAQESNRSKIILSTGIGGTHISTRIFSEDFTFSVSMVPMVRLSRTIPIRDNKILFEPFIGYMYYNGIKTTQDARTFSTNVLEAGGLLQACMGNFQIAPGLKTQGITHIYKNYRSHVSYSFSAGAHFRYNISKCYLGMECWYGLSDINYLGLRHSSEPKTKETNVRIVVGFKI